MAMGYRVLPYQVRFQFHPALAPLLTSRLGVAAASALARRWPRSQRLELVAKVVQGARLSREPRPGGG
jgi:hypothetical protein